MHTRTPIKRQAHHATDASQASAATISLSQGFTLLDLLIAATIMSIVISYALTEIVHGEKAAFRDRDAQEFATYLERGRNDSVLDGTTEPWQGPRISIVSNHYYNAVLGVY